MVEDRVPKREAIHFVGAEVLRWLRDGREQRVADALPYLPAELPGAYPTRPDVWADPPGSTLAQEVQQARQWLRQWGYIEYPRRGGVRITPPAQARGLRQILAARSRDPWRV
jgi:hypothetical protein